MSFSGRLRSALRLAAFGLVVAGVVSVFSISGASAARDALAQVASSPVREVQVLEQERTGVASPVGLAFSSSSKAFYVVGARAGTLPETDVAKLTPFALSPTSDRSGSARIAAAVQDPINMAFDASRNRLLLLGHARQLLEVRAAGGGDLDRQSLNRRDAARFGLKDPQGMAVDPASGTVFILDANLPRILRVEPAPDGSFEAATTSEIDLRPAGLRGVRGLAFDPSTGHLHLGSARKLLELTTDGVVVATRDLSAVGFTKSEGLVFAPSGDQTDASSQLSLYLADSGTAPTGSSGPAPSAAPIPAPSVGQIVELSLAPQASIAAINFTSQLVRTVDMAAFSPPSPDPSGITYVSSTDRLLVSDGEVEETVNGITHFQGANIWELNRNGLTLARTANVSKKAPIQVSMTDEPAGAGFNSANGHYYFAEDGQKRIYDLNPGADGVITSGDSFTFFTVSGFGNTDPEGVTYNAVNGRVYVADGVNNEVYEYSTAGALLGHFDTQQYGVADPEAVEANPQTGTLYVLSNRQSGPIIIETTTGGALLQTIDVSAAGAQKPAGLAYANASNGSGAKRFYWVDRGIDNNSNPNIVDGKLYEMTTPGGGGPPGNQAPTVGAGLDQTITLPAGATLDATVTDDGLPSPPGTVTTTWTATGPGTVTFGNANAVDTTATFSQAGTYVLRLTASDSALSAFDELTVTVEAGGGGGGQFIDVRVNANQNDAEQRTNNAVNLANADLDMMSADESNTIVGTRFVGVAIPPGAIITDARLQFQADEASSVGTSLTIRGEAADNPLVFAATTNNLSSRPKTTASQTWPVAPWLAVGNALPAQRSTNLAAIIQEIVDRSGWTSGNALALFVTGSGTRVAVAHNFNPAAAPLLHVEWVLNTAPVVNVGGDQTITLPSGATLNATVTDDGKPTPPSLTYAWSQQSGPAGGTASFATPNAEDTTVTFDLDGDYVLRLTASDGALPGFDELTVHVNPEPPNTAPVVNVGGDQTITLPSGATLNATVTDDGKPTPPSLTYAWSQQSGPAGGTASFATPNAEDTTVTFDLDGDYVLRLTASDGALPGFDELTVHVNPEPPNTAPVVNVGGDQTITLPSGATLNATVTDDGKPTPPSLTYAWSQQSGPAGGTASFATPNAEDTTVTFDLDGDYVLRLTASDGALPGFDELTVHVNPEPPNTAPVVNVGGDQTITLPSGATLNATVTDDGKPTPPSLTYAWSQQSGPAGGTASFATPNAEDTTVTFDLDGDYVLRLTANDGALPGFDELTVHVNPEPPNTAPVVNVGGDQTITLPSGATLNATVTDDGKPTPPSLTYAWSQQSGPAGGTASFATPNAEDTTVTFDLDGDYVLRLTANDGALPGFDELTVTVNPEQPANIFQVRVSTNQDDGEQRTSNVVGLASPDLDMMSADELNTLVGVRFRGVAIPPGAIITNAYLQFQADEAHSIATSLTIRGEAADNSLVFSTTNNNLSSRQTTTASQTWTVDPWLAVGNALPAQQSPDLAAIVQEIVNRTGWTSGNSLVFLLTGSGTRVAVTHNQNPAAAALLHVEWTTVTPLASARPVPSVDAGPDRTFAHANALDTSAGSRAGSHVSRLLVISTFLGLVAALTFSFLFLRLAWLSDFRHRPRDSALRRLRLRPRAANDVFAIDLP